jgi:hypothetical protein
MEKQKKTPGQRAITIGKITLGAFIMPILFAAFIADRIILVFLPHVNGQTVQETFKNLKHFSPVFWRVGFVLFVYLLSILFKYVF